MIFLLFLIGSSIGTSASNKLGIGLGAYPNGLLSLKYRSSPNLVLQLTVGTSTWHYHQRHWKSVVTLGGRVVFQIGEGGNGYKFMHLIGIGAGVHSYTREEECDIMLIGEAFYEFELFPIPQELPLSVGLGAGIWGEMTDIDLAIFPSIHFYFK